MKLRNLISQLLNSNIGRRVADQITILTKRDIFFFKCFCTSTTRVVSKAIAEK